MEFSDIGGITLGFNRKNPDLRGIGLNNLGNYTGAIQYFDKALAIDPGLNYIIQ